VTVLQSIILGIVEGMTEFLPVSSTFHLIWAGKILDIQQTDLQKMFDVFIQSGAISAVFLLYFKTVITNKKLISRIIFSFIPTAIIGFILYKTIKGVFFENFFLQIFIFIAIGIIFLVFEKNSDKKAINRNIDSLTAKEAILIGIIQALAVFPGVSRAGAVIIGMVFLKIKREEAAKYSFLLAVPTIFAASTYDLLKNKDLLIAQSQNMLLLIIGFTAAFLSALIVVRWFIGYLQKNTLAVFGWYRIVLGTLLAGFLYKY
jgi:undecaprenyl-diphosphatase